MSIQGATILTRRTPTFIEPHRVAVSIQDATVLTRRTLTFIEPHRVAVSIQGATILTRRTPTFIQPPCSSKYTGCNSTNTTYVDIY